MEKELAALFSYFYSNNFKWIAEGMRVTVNKNKF